MCDMRVSSVFSGGAWWEARYQAMARTEFFYGEGASIDGGRKAGAFPRLETLANAQCDFFVPGCTHPLITPPKSRPRQFDSGVPVRAMDSSVPATDPRSGNSSFGADSVPNDSGLDPSHLQGEDEDEEVRNRRRKRRLQTYIRCASLTTVYYGCSMAYYTQRAYKPCSALADCTRPSQWCHWDAADAIYFATVTMTTVGYGDLKPGPPNKLENQLVTVVLLIFGVIVCLGWRT